MKVKIILPILLLVTYSWSSLAQCDPDITPPTPICQISVNISLPTSGGTAVLPSFVDIGSLDNCTDQENLTFSINPSFVDCSDIGAPISATMTVTDEAGNSDFCEFTIHVEDKLPPVPLCFAHVNVSLGASGEYVLTQEVFNAGSIDNCTAPENLSFVFSPAMLDCSDLGEVEATMTVIDESGNSDFCEFTILVESESPTSLACFANVNVSLGSSGELTLDKDFLLASGNNYCGATYTIDPPSVDCSDIGEAVLVTVTLTDSEGGENSCFSIVNVEDKFPPTLACFANVNVSLVVSGEVTFDESILVASADDNCDITYSFDPPTANCDDVGSPITVVITATDPGGNAISCFSTVTVEDKIPPTLACFANVNVSLGVSGEVTFDESMLVASADDNCDLTFSFDPPTADCDDVGTAIIVVITATDPGGNITSCFSTVIVEDKLAPSISCIANPTITLDAGGVKVFTSSDLIASEADNCALSYSFAPAQVDCSDAGKDVVVTITAVDPGGNTATCFSTISVVDPRPNSCEINGPSVILCGESGVNFTALVAGGAGPFIYDWTIKKGTNTGWSISSGQGTPNLEIQAGSGKFSLDLEITDVCGKSRKCKFMTRCSGSAPSAQPIQGAIEPEISDRSNMLKIYPNPSKSILNIQIPYDQLNHTSLISIFNAEGRTIKTLDPTLNNFSLEVEDWSRGLYFLHWIKNNGENHTTKLILID